MGVLLRFSRVPPRSLLSWVCRVALLNQHHGDQINLDENALDFLCSQYTAGGGGAISRQVLESMRAHLSSCGIEHDLQLVPGRALSGGQRSRLAMAAVSFSRPHVLILDEPTSNLDVEAVEALAESIEQFEGGVVIVSHDQYFVGRVANEVWVVQNQRVSRVESFEAYVKAAYARAASQQSGGGDGAGGSQSTGRPLAAAEAKFRGATTPSEVNTAELEPEPEPELGGGGEAQEVPIQPQLSHPVTATARPITVLERLEARKREAKEAEAAASGSKRLA
eukprot:SAG22_NODE_4215_length_1341_cov_1.264090_2_plen_279_part_00